MQIDYRIILENNIKGKIIDTKSGASGVVYIVDNGEGVIPRKIAYKSIRVDKLEETKKQHFFDECKIWFSKSNHYLVNAFYPVVIDDLPFICMPYYELDLKNFMLEKKLTELEALVISCQISKALMEMNKAGISYHQDFNPPNLLLSDLTNKFSTYPTNNLLNYSIKIADLGIADLIERIGPTNGSGGGKFPFKAPEQYYPKKYESYNPDIFALGVITFMLFTGKHPNGLDKEKALNKNTSSSEFDEWALNAVIELENKEIQKIINKALQANPIDRPNAEEFYNTLISQISYQDKYTYENLKLRFDYFDTLGRTYSISDETFALKRLSELPNNKKPILDKVLDTLKILFSQIQSESDVIKLGDYYTLFITLSDNNKDSHVIIETSEKLVQVLYEWYPKIKVEHKYPAFELNGTILNKTPDFRDIEIVIGYISVVYEILCKIWEIEKIEELFKKYRDDKFYSFLLYSKASSIRNTEINKCIEMLKEAGNLFNNEPLFDYMKYLWITHHLILKEDKSLEAIKNETFKKLKDKYVYWDTIKKL